MPKMIRSFANIKGCVYEFKSVKVCFFATMILISVKVKQFLVFSIKLMVVVFAFYFIYTQLLHNTKLNWVNFWILIQTKATFGTVFFILTLSFCNRFLEILKWQNLVSVIKPVSIFESTKQVLASLTVGIFTPNGIGEYAGKALFYPKTETKKIIFLNLICNGIQMIITIFFGTLGLFILGFYKSGLFITLFLLSCTILLFTSKKIKGYSIQKLMFHINKIPKKIHQKNIFYGLLRYLIFTHQFYFIFIFFGVNLPYLSMMASKSCIYFLSSSLPSFQFLDFAVKGGVAVYYLGLLGVNEWIVIIVTTLMWFLNVVVPIAIGSFFVLGYKPNTLN